MSDLDAARRLAACAILAVLAGSVFGCSEPSAPQAVLAGGLVPAAGAATAQSTADWPSSNRDPAATRFSPLRDVDVDNVAELRVAWAYALDAANGAAPWGGAEGTPLYADDKLILAAGDRVVALNPESGNEIWRYVLERGTPARRGIAYWPGDGRAAARVLFTAGQRLLALDAATGTPAATFGTGGEVALDAAHDSPPVVVGGAIIVGASGAGLRAFDIVSGARLWTFATTRHSYSVAVDVDRRLVYATFDGADVDGGDVDGADVDGGDVDGADVDGGDVDGANVDGAAVVALDARSGDLVWRSSLPRGASVATNVPPTPILVDLTLRGVPRALLVQASPHGLLHVLDRATGEPLFARDAAAAEPKPPPIARIRYDAADLVTAQDTTAEHARLCRALLERSGARVVFPGGAGSVGFGGAAADPRTGLVYVNTTSEGSVLVAESSVAARRSASETAFGQRVPFRAERATDPLAIVVPPRRGVRGGARGEPAVEAEADGARAGAKEAEPVELGWPCQKPPWGELVAVDVARGTIAWRVPLGITEQLPEDRRHTGRPNAGGPIVTAGNLVFVAATDDRRFRAFDAASGEELWSDELPAAAHAVPMTYRTQSGRQYVALVAAGPVASVPDGAQVLVAYALD